MSSFTIIIRKKMNLLYLVKTIFQLRKKSLFCYVFYKIRLKWLKLLINKEKNRTITLEWPQDLRFTGSFTAVFNNHYFNEHILGESSIQESGKVRFFFKDYCEVGSPPKWFYFPEHEEKKDWLNYEINNIKGNDIKLSWELSRFTWLLNFGAAYAASGENKWLTIATNWLEDWISHNPYGESVNWVCAQECSIRLLNFILFIAIIDSKLHDKECIFIHDFILSHVLRIKETVLYSVSQDNNHAISEASALFVASNWAIKNLKPTGLAKKEFDNAIVVGRNILVERVNTLVLPDGGFSMYSTNYHRSVLNTLVIVEYFTRIFEVSSFDDSFYKKCQSLTLWLSELCDVNSGSVPNFGANDGSLPFLIQCLDYSDYRTTIRTAAYMFLKKAVTDIDESACSLYWLGIRGKVETVNKLSELATPRLFLDSGIVKYTINRKFCLFVRFPCYDFRPSQCDLFHVDVWYDGVNVLRDLGSYSYNDSLGYGEALAKINKHNTVCVDSLEPMPRLGRFLLGCWPKTRNLTIFDNYFEAYYSSVFGYTHKRKIMIFDDKLTIIDQIYGANDDVTLNFNIPDGDYSVSKEALESNTVSIKVTSSYQISTTLKPGIESRYYNHADKIFHFIASVKPKGGEAVVLTEVIFRH